MGLVWACGGWILLGWFYLCRVFAWICGCRFVCDTCIGIYSVCYFCCFSLVFRGGLDLLVGRTLIGLVHGCRLRV